MREPSILIVYAGGTIGMVPGPDGLIPSVSFVQQIDGWIADRPGPAVRHRVIALEPLMDSANADARTWHRLAGLLWDARDTFAAAVVLHGTDTLCYTASTLSFLLAGFGKPIVLTGAQIPFSAPDSDARSNLLGALACATADLHEVCVFFDGTLMRGNRTRKWSTRRGEGFISPHWPPLARFDDRPRLDSSALLPRPPVTRCRPPPPARMQAGGLVKMFPGLDARVLLAAVDAHPDGLVLELYGAGTGPVADRAVRRALETIAGSGVPMIGVSQCVRGTVDPERYETGRILADCGVAHGHDLTAEAALTKLHCLRCEEKGDADIGALIARPVAGELTLANPS
jgi:L-asparaginase